MKLSISQLKNLRKMCYELCKFVAGGGVLAPVLGFSATSYGFIESTTSILFAILFYFIGYHLDGKVDALEQQEQLIATTHKRKHKIRIPRNTTVSVEVEG